jgi:hypothetical protein
MTITLNGTTGITTPAETATTSVTTPLVTSPAATALTIQSAGTTAMTVDTSQNVGIGTTSPSFRFQVNGTSAQGPAALVSSAQTGTAVRSNHVFRIQSEATGRDVYMQYSDNVSYSTEIGMVNGNQYFCTAGVERARIDTSGNLLVGGTSPIVNEKFLVYGSNANFISRMYNTNATPYGLLVSYTSASPNVNDYVFFYAADSTALRFNVASNGGISNYSANNVNISDGRLKKDIQLSEPYLDKICAIPVKTFLYNDQTDTDLNLGVIAQDVDAIAPELVCRDGWRDKDGGPTDYLTIYQTDLQYALMKCIQELSAKNDALEARLAALEAK